MTSPIISIPKAPAAHASKRSGVGGIPAITICRKKSIS